MKTNYLKPIILILSIFFCYLFLFLLSGGKMSASLHLIAFFWVHIPVVIFLLFRLGIREMLNFSHRVIAEDCLPGDSAVADRIISLTLLSGFLFSGYGLIASFIALNKIEDIGAGFSAMIHGPICGAMLPLFFTILEVCTPVKTIFKILIAISYYVPVISVSHYTIISLTN